MQLEKAKLHGTVPITSLVVVSARNEVLEGWRLLCVLVGVVAALHIAKLALEGPGLNYLLYMSPQHLPQSILTVSDSIWYYTVQYQYNSTRYYAYKCAGQK